MSEPVAAEREPTVEEVRAAVACLSRGDLYELAKGPIVDKADADRCRVCECFDDYLWGHGPSAPEARAVGTLIDWHRWWGSPAHDGRGAEAARRCQVIYDHAREILAAQNLSLLKLECWQATILLSFPGLTREQAAARTAALIAELEARSDVSPVLCDDLEARDG